MLNPTSEYPDYVEFVPAESGGTYDANRVYTPGTTAPTPAWKGYADVQDGGQFLLKGREGDESRDFDATVFFAEVDEAEALAAVAVGMNCVTPFGTGRVVRLVHLDGQALIRYVR